MLSNLGPSQGRKGVENGPIWDHKWLKNGSKPLFSKNDPSLVVVPKWMNTTHFEPLLSCSHPPSTVYLISGVVEVSYMMFLPPPDSVPIFILARVMVWLEGRQGEVRGRSG